MTRNVWTLSNGILISMAVAMLSPLRANEALLMTVTASPLVAEDVVTPYGGTATIVNREQIDYTGLRDMQSALQRVPGVTISRYTLLGAFGGADGGSIYIRGRGTGRPGADIVVYQDDVPRKVGVWDHPLMDALAIDHAERITIYKGPQPVYNSGTFGSADIRSRRRSREGFETEMEGAAGEDNTWSTRLHHGGLKDGNDYYIGLSHKESDGHRPHSAVELQSLYGRVGSRLGNVLSLSAQVMVTDNKVEDPGTVGQPVPLRDQFATRTITTAVRLDNRYLHTDGFALIYHEDGQIRWDKDRIGGPETPPGASNTDWENYGLRAAQHLRMAALTLRFGLEAASEGGATENRTISGAIPFSFKGRYETITPGIAADFALELFPSWVFQPSAGVHYNIHSEFEDKAAPHAGVAIKGREWTLFANISRGIHYPGVYANGITAATMDRLEAETLDHQEAGVFWRDSGHNVQLGLTLFRDLTDNLLQWTPAGLINAGNADIDGLELSTRLQPADRFALYAALTLLDPKDERIPRAPEWTFSAGASLAITARLQIYADVDAVAEQYAFNNRAGAGERNTVEKLDGYTVGNLRLSYNAIRTEDLHLTLVAACDNIADVSYETLAGYPLPGRFYNGSVRVAF